MQVDASGSPPAAKTASRLVWGGLVAVLAAVAAAGIVSLLRSHGAESDPPVLGEVPSFQLTERSGQPFGLADLRGSDWIADFVFTRCAGTCPLLSDRMARLQRKLDVGGQADLRLVSFSVDPAFDTPEVLREYAKRLRASPQGWLFLTGERQALYALIKDGFRLSVAESEDAQADPNEMITHSDRFVLVDRRGRIRGYYHGTEDESVARLLDDLAKLRKEAS